MKKLVWVQERGQQVWAWIAVAFALFYFGEAFLFWEPSPRVQAPPFTPLVYWGAFGAVIIWLVRRQAKKAGTQRTAEGVPSGLQSAILGVGITASVIGIPMLVMGARGNIDNRTLGHAVLLGTMFEAAIVIGGMSCNLGWLAASVLWLASAYVVLRYPPLQDITLGAAVAAGFALVGTIRWSARERDPADAPTPEH